MSLFKGLKVFGTDIEKGFSWFGSPKGQTVVKTGETILEAAVPISAPIVGLFNVWAARAYNVEALAVTAGQANGTGAEKAVLAISSVVPEVLRYAAQEGLSARTDQQISDANNAVVAFIKAMTE